MNLLRALQKLPAGRLRRLLKAKKLLQLQDSLAGQVAELKSRLGRTETKLVRVTNRIRKMLDGSLGNGRRRASRPAPATAAKARVVRKGSLKDVLLGQLRALGRPAGATELAGLARKAGYATKSRGRVFVQAVYQALAKGGGFRKVGRGRYTPQE